MLRSKFHSTALVRAEAARPNVVLRVVASLAGGLLLATGFAGTAAASAGPTSVDLGSAASFSILCRRRRNDSGEHAPGQVGAVTAITDDANTVYGAQKHTPNDAATQQALSDARSAFTTLDGLSTTGVLAGADLGGQTITPGVYHSTVALAATTAVTFDAGGNANAYFVIQGDATLGTTASTTMSLTGGAQASHIFWVLKSAATLGASSTFDGTILSEAAITVGASVHLNGRALSLPAAVSLDADVFGPVVAAAPAVTIVGGPNASTADSTPTIHGTTDAPAGTAVLVTVGTTTLSTTVLADGTWTVTVGTALPDGAVTVAASITPTEELTGTATQILTIDTTAPSLTIAGGPLFTTRDSTPTIDGTTDAQSGSIVTVTVAGQTLSATVTAGGTWSVVAALLPAGVATVTASVSDAVGNLATATQQLTVDLAPPVVHTLSDHVYFLGDSAVITTAARTEIAALIRRVPAAAITITVHITGYIKLIGRATENKRLATARAQSVYLLMKNKVAGVYTLTGVSKGLSHLVTARRTDVVISYTLPSGS